MSETGIEVEELDEDGSYDEFVESLVDSWFKEPETFSIQIETKRG